MNDTNPLHGVIPIVPTPFRDDGALDLDSLPRVLDHLAAAGVHGVAVLGMASETYSLTEAERESVIARAAAHLAGRLPLVAGCSHNSGPAVAQLAVQAQQAGADALMMMPPAIASPGPAVIRDYFATAGVATDLPIMIQDNPSWTGTTIPIDTYRELCELPTVRYAKIETRHPPTTIAAVRDLVGDRLAILGGQAGIWLPEEVARGSVGTMPASIMPDAYVEMWQLWASGQPEAARRVFDSHYPLIRVTSAPTVGIPMSKVILHRLGLLTSPTVRTPLQQLAERDLADLDAVIGK